MRFGRKHRRGAVPLRRRIFLWFGVTIVVAGCASWAVALVVSGGPTSWKREVEGMKRFGANRFADVWDEPEKRHRLVEDVAMQLDVDVTVRDENGTVIDSVGDPCEKGSVRLKPQRGASVLGTVDVCRDGASRGHVSGIVGLLVALGVLWAVSHKIAKRLGRPLEALMHATSEIGRGRYDVKVHVHHEAPVEIHRLAEAFGDMAGKIERQMADQRELLASVSHEVRSPLARVRLVLEMLRDEKLTTEGREKLLGELDHEVEEIDDLVGGLLASSRVDFSALTLRPHDLVAAARRATERAGLKASPRIVGEPREVRCDATLIARALANLIDNATKHGDGAKGMVVRFEDDRAYLEIEDEGPGFSDGEADRAFDPFYGKPKGSHDSLGLGLALVQRIARAHGGDAFARNRAGAGAVVGIWLPAGQGVDADGIPSSWG